MTVQDRPISDHDRPETAQDGSDFVPVAEAARRLGISTATVKRRIAAGTLEAEQLPRPQGIEYRVRLARDVPAPLSERSASDEPPSTGTAQDVSGVVEAAVAPLAEANARQHETIERQAGEVADLREQHGRLAVELVETKVRLVEAKVERDAAESSRRRDTRRLALAVAVLIALLVAMLVAPTWAR